MDIQRMLDEAKVQYDKGSMWKFNKILHSILDETEDQSEFPGVYIVVETHGGPEYATVCLDEDGEVVTFDSRKDARKFADEECQMGILVEV